MEGTRPSNRRSAVEPADTHCLYYNGEYQPTSGSVETRVIQDLGGVSARTRLSYEGLDGRFDDACETAAVKNAEAWHSPCPLSGDSG